MNPLQVAIVGSGIISLNHASAIVRNPRLRISDVVDPDPDANSRLADQVETDTGARPAEHASLTQALLASDATVVVICTPSGLHAELAEEALLAGRHVVIEKPIDADLPRARHLAEVAAAATARGQVCTVICQHRFDPASVVTHEAIVDGRFGRITSATASVAWWRTQQYYDSGGWRGTWGLDGGGATMNQGVHTVDLLLWMLGEPVEVYAHVARLGHTRIEVEDVLTATVRFASGALAALHCTTAAYPGIAVRLQVHGTHGSAVLHDDQLELFHVSDDEDAQMAAQVIDAGELRGADRPSDAFVIGHQRQYDDIVTAIDEGRTPGVTVQDGLTALAMVRALYVSATLGRAIPVADVLAGAYDDVKTVVDQG